MPRNYQRRSATAEQIATILQLQKILKLYVADENSFLTNILMYFPLPYITDSLVMHTPLYTLNGQFKMYAASLFDRNVGPGIDSSLSIVFGNNPGALESLNPRALEALNSLYALAKNVTDETFSNFYAHVTPILKSNIHNQENFNTPESGIFWIATIVISTSVVQMHNQCHVWYSVLPSLIITRSVALLTKLIVVDRAVNKLFPRGIIPLLSADSFELSTISYDVAETQHNKLLLTTERLGWLNLLLKMISLVYLVAYPLYVFYNLKNSTEKAWASQEVHYYDNVIAPVFVSLMILALNNSISVLRQCWRSYNFQSELNLRQGQLVGLTQLLSPDCFTLHVDRGSSLERSSFRLEFSPNLSFLAGDAQLKAKKYISMLRNLIAGKIPVLYANNKTLILDAKYTLTDKQFELITGKLPNFIERMISLKNNGDAIIGQFRKLLREGHLECEWIEHIDVSGLPVLSFLLPVSLNTIDDSQLPCHVRDEGGYVRIDVASPLLEDEYHILHTQIRNLRPALQQEFAYTNSEDFVRPDTSSAHRRSRPLAREKKTVVRAPNPPDEPLEIRWHCGAVYSESPRIHSTASLLRGGFFAKNGLFAQYEGRIRDPNMAEHFRSIIKEGSIVPPHGNQGIVVSEDKWVMDPNTGNDFRATWKVKSKHLEYGGYRLYGRVKETLGTGKDRRMLLAFSACVHTHN